MRASTEPVSRALSEAAIPGLYFGALGPQPGVGRALALAVDTDERFEEEAVRERSRLGPQAPDGDRASERLADLAFLFGSHPLEHRRHVARLQRRPRVLHDGAVERVAVGESRARDQYGEEGGQCGRRQTQSHDFTPRRYDATPRPIRA
jgi:hypothetical protein